MEALMPLIKDNKIEAGHALFATISEGHIDIVKAILKLLKSDVNIMDKVPPLNKYFSKVTLLSFMHAT